MMIYCLVCGTANKDSSKFCDECGDQLAAQGAKRSDLPPWVTEMEKALRTQAAAGDDGELEEILEVPDWFLDLQASQPDRFVEDALELGVGENGTGPAWLAAVRGRQVRAESPPEEVEPLQAQADFQPADGDSVQTESPTWPAATGSQQTASEPPQAAREPLPTTAQSPWAVTRSPRTGDQPPKAVPRPPQAAVEPSEHAPNDRRAGDVSPRWLQDFRATEPDNKTTRPSGESDRAKHPSHEWLEDSQPVEAASTSKALADVGEPAEESATWPQAPLPSAQAPGEGGTITRNEHSGRQWALKLRNLRGGEAKLQDETLALDQNSHPGEWLRDLVEALPVQASLVQDQAAALPETQPVTPDRFTSRARVFSELVTHPPAVATVATGQPEPRLLSRLARYAMVVVLIGTALCAILGIAFDARLSPLAGWIESILENLGGLLGG